MNTVLSYFAKTSKLTILGSLACSLLACGQPTTSSPTTITPDATPSMVTTATPPMPVASLTPDVSPSPQSNPGQTDAALADASPDRQQTDRQQIEFLVNQYLNPAATASSSPGTIEKLAIVDDIALVSWLWSEAGGQMLLKKEQGSWTVVTFGGGFLGINGLLEHGVPRTTAEALLDETSPNWRQFQ